MRGAGMSWEQLPAESRRLHLSRPLSLLRPSLSREGRSHPLEALLCNWVLCNSLPHRQPCPEAVLRDLCLQCNFRGCKQHPPLRHKSSGRHKSSIGSTLSLLALHMRHRRGS